MQEFLSSKVHFCLRIAVSQKHFISDMTICQNEFSIANQNDFTKSWNGSLHERYHGPIKSKAWILYFKIHHATFHISILNNESFLKKTVWIRIDGALSWEETSIIFALHFQLSYLIDEICKMIQKFQTFFWLCRTLIFEKRSFTFWDPVST